MKNIEILHELQLARTTDCNRLNNFCGGNTWKEHSLFGTVNDALQILDYFDELEITNPIGSYVNTHKLGCLFFTLGNIRPMYRSSLKAIYLVAVARSQNIDRYGMDCFLKPFVEDMKRLYIDGLTVTGGSNEHTYFGALIAFLADTAAAHKVGGFKGCVSFARRICRSCMAPKDDSQTHFDEILFELRTPQNHEALCQSLTGSQSRENSVKYGINRTSILEEVPGYSLATGMPHDIMHDLFEGVVHYELKLFLFYCVFKKYFSIDTLNTRIRGYDFGSED